MSACVKATLKGAIKGCTQLFWKTKAPPSKTAPTKYGGKATSGRTAAPGGCTETDTVNLTGVFVKLGCCDGVTIVTVGAAAMFASKAVAVVATTKLRSAVLTATAPVLVTE